MRPLQHIGSAGRIAAAVASAYNPSFALPRSFCSILPLLLPLRRSSHPPSPLSYSVTTCQQHRPACNSMQASVTGVQSSYTKLAGLQAQQPGGRMQRQLKDAGRTRLLHGTTAPTACVRATCAGLPMSALLLVSLPQRKVQATLQQQADARLNKWTADE